MHGNIVNMVQKNIESLKSEVRNVIKKSTIQSLPSINRNSGNLKTISHDYISINTRRKRSSLSKEPSVYENLSIQRGRSISYKEESEDETQYKIILMNPKKKKHPQRILAGKVQQRSVSLEPKSQMETIENILTEKQQKNKKAIGDTLKIATVEDKEKKIFKRKKKQKQQEYDPSQMYLRKRRPFLPKPIKTDIKMDESIQNIEYTPWQNSLQNEELSEIIMNNRY